MAEASGQEGVALAPDGKIVAFIRPAGEPPQLAVVDPATGRQISAAKAGEGLVIGLVISPDGKSLATATGEVTTVGIWDFATLNQRRATTLGTAGAGLAFPSDGQTLRVIIAPFAGETTMSSIDTANGKLTERGGLGSAIQLTDFSWSPDGRVLAATGWAGNLSGFMAETDSARIYLFNAATGKQIREFTGVRFVPAHAAFSANGKWLAAGDWNGAITTWDVATGKQVRELRGHRGQVISLAFSADGKRLASGSVDTTVLIWDVSEVRPASK